MESTCIYLPSELLTQIFQYLPLEDYPNISLSNKRFFSLVRKSFLEWSRNLLAQTLNPYSESQAHLKSLIPASFTFEALFQDDLEPQNILRDRSLIQKQWDLFAENYLPAGRREELGKELVSVLRNPTPPFPCLKRDTQCFKTNSMFQNFLTEVYFELNKKCYLKDPKAMMIQAIVDNFKVSEENVDDLAKLRWSLFNTEIETGEKFEMENEEDQIDNKNMQENSMKKKHGIKTKKSFMKQFKLSKKYRQKRRIQNDSNSRSSANGGEKFEEERPNDAAKLFELIYKLGQNHCQMVRSYMASIREPMDLLNEYIKLWDTYVMITINFDEMFNSVSDYASEAYNKRFGNNNNAKFPIWKLMIKAWTTEVFLPLSRCLAKILCSISYDLRNKKQSQPENGFMFGKFDEDEDSKFENQRKIVRLVQEVYNAISDLSYNETTIFFSECALTNPQTPKRLLDLEILKNVLQLYKRDDLLAKNDSSDLKHIFEDDVKFTKELFGREMKYQVLELQSSFMKTELFGVYEDVLMNLKIDENEDLRKGRVLNFKKMYSVFEIDNKEEKSKICQAKMTEGILRDCPLFEDFVDVMAHLKEAIQVERYKSKQRAMSLLQKGFYLIQEERCPFQAGVGHKKSGHKGLVKAQ